MGTTNTLIMKYRLKKWYPSLYHSIKEGDIVKRIQKGSIIQYLHSMGITINLQEVENNPEFWEPVGDYEILSFTNSDNKVYKKYDDGYRTIRYSFTLKQALENSHMKIHSVRRLSDGEVFTVGDRVELTGKSLYNGKIKLFKIEENHIRVRFPYDNNEIESAISGIQHHKEPLFTTHDGIDIYPGTETTAVLKHTLQLVGTNYHKGNDVTLLYFSTKEKAKEFIDENEKKYSKKDIKEAMDKIGFYDMSKQTYNKSLWFNLNGNN